MTDLRTAAQQALEALHEIGWSNNTQWQSDRAATVIPALRAALAENERDWSLLEVTQESLREHMAEIHRLRAKLPEPVPCNPSCAPGYCYCAPPQRTLTDEEMA